MNDLVSGRDCSKCPTDIQVGRYMKAQITHIPKMHVVLVKPLQLHRWNNFKKELSIHLRGSLRWSYIRNLFLKLGTPVVIEPRHGDSLKISALYSLELYFFEQIDADFFLHPGWGSSGLCTPPIFNDYFGTIFFPNFEVGVGHIYVDLACVLSESIINSFISVWENEFSDLGIRDMLILQFTYPFNNYTKTRASLCSITKPMYYSHVDLRLTRIRWKWIHYGAREQAMRLSRLICRIMFEIVVPLEICDIIADFTLNVQRPMKEI